MLFWRFKLKDVNKKKDLGGRFTLGVPLRVLESIEWSPPNWQIGIDRKN